MNDLSVNEDLTDENNSLSSNIKVSNDIIIENNRLSGWVLGKSLLGGAVGNLLEWYDFALFGLLANEIGDKFFPHGSNTVHLFEVFGLFSASFLMRPLGGVIFGYLGDKYGRIYALRISLIMMSIPSFLIGILPSYNTIGIFSTISIILLRLIQGISAGGEVTGSLVYVLEICPINHRALFGILVQISCTGILLASIVVSILKLIFTKNEIKHYAWRIPFLLGVILLFFGLFIRKYLKDSNEFLNVKKTKQILENPVKFIFKNMKLELIILIFTRSLSAVTYYVFFVWMPNYLQSKNLRKNENYIIHNPYIINTIALITSSIAMVFAGHLGDIYKPIKILIIFGILFLASIIVLIPLIQYTKNKLLIAFEINGLSIGFGLYAACLEVFCVDIFYDNVNIRYSAVGVGYNIGNAIFAGLTPLMATIIVKFTGIIGFTIVLSVIGINSLFFMSFKDYLLEKRNNYYKNKMIDSSDNKYEALNDNQNIIQN